MKCGVYGVVDKINKEGEVTLFILKNEEIERFVKDNNMVKISEDHEPCCWYAINDDGDIYLDTFASLEEAENWIKLCKSEYKNL